MGEQLVLGFGSKVFQKVIGDDDSGTDTLSR